MIIRESKFVIYCPTKTGMMSLRNWGQKNGMEYRTPQHNVRTDDDAGWLDQIMLVRDPYERMLSMWSHLRRWKSDWGHSTAAVMDFPEWVGWWYDQRTEFLDNVNIQEVKEWRAPWRWILSCSELYELNGNIGTAWPTEHLDELPRWLQKEYHLDDLSPMAHANRSDRDRAGHRAWGDALEWYSHMALLKVNDAWAELDCEKFNYEFQTEL